MGIYCQVCQSQTLIERPNIFYGHHVKKEHNLSSKEYYDQYLKKADEGFCKVCQKEVSFISPSKGYQKYCSKDCLFQDEEIKSKWKETNLQKYGSTSPLGSKQIREKTKQTIKEKYGVDFISQNKEVKEKATKTFKEKYGIGSENHKIVTSKRKDTLIKRYGSEYEQKISETRKKNNVEKYGVEHTVLLDSVKQKREMTNLEKFGVKNSLSCPEIREKIHKTNLERYGSIYPIISKEKRDELNQRIYFDKINESLPDGYELLKFIPKKYYQVKCNLGHEFELFNYNLINNRTKRNQTICPLCNPQTEFQSGFEKEIIEFIKQNCENIVIKNRNIISPFELDIYLPDFNLAIECNGVWYHNELYKFDTYHLNKTELCEAKGIQLIHIYEDDWIYKKEIVQSRLLNIFKKSKIYIYARKCEIKEVPLEESKQFLELNHIQGNCVSKFRYGLYHNNELVSLMTFGNKRLNLGAKFNENTFELLRFCNKLNTNVMGSASKLFKYFIKNNQFESIISYADRSWSQGDLYYKLGFRFVRKTKPNYWYVVKDKRINRFNFRKDILISEGFEANKSEHQIMLERKIYRIYDSGSLLFELKM